MPEPNRPLKVFLSYASQDKPLVRELSRRLESEGWIDPWVDEKKLLPGQDWRTKIEEAVETSDAVIICLSNNSVTKEGFVQKELRYAREIAFEKPDETIFLIPLRLDDCTVPRGLRFYQWADYFGEEKEETYNDLLESLKLRYEQKLKLETEERARKEKAERERIALEEVARKEAEEMARLEAEERARQEREERERKAVEEKARKEAEEKARLEAEERKLRENVEKERKAAELAAREKEKRELAEKANREKAEREAIEKAARQKEKRDTAEKAKRERARRRAAQLAALREALSKSAIFLKEILSKTIPFLRIVGFAGIAIALIWIGLFGFSKLALLIPSPESTSVQPPIVQVTSTNSLVSPTKTLKPNATSTKSPNLTPTSTIQPIALPSSIMLGNINTNLTEVISPNNISRLAEIGQFQATGAQKLAFSPNGDYLAIGFKDGKVQVWQLSSGKLISEFATQHKDVIDIEFSPDSSLLAVATNYDFPSFVKIWKLSDGSLYRSFQKSDAINKIAFSHSGDMIATGTWTRNVVEKPVVRIWNLENQEVLHEFTDINSTVIGLAFTPNDDLLIAAPFGFYGDGALRIWRTSDGAISKYLDDGHGQYTRSMALSLNGSLVATTGDKLRLWNLDGSLVTERTISGEGEAIAMSPDGKLLLNSVSNYPASDVVEIWDISKRTVLKSIDVGDNAPFTVAFSPDAKFISYISNSTIVFWGVK